MNRAARGERRWPRALSLLGLVGCLVLAFTLPVESIAAGVGVFALGAALYAVRHPPGFVRRKR